jgi:hypothetical protein
VSTTPRTDAEATNCNEIDIHDGDAVVYASFASQLEAELNEANADLASVRAKLETELAANRELETGMCDKADELNDAYLERNQANTLAAIRAKELLRIQTENDLLKSQLAECARTRRASSNQSQLLPYRCESGTKTRTKMVTLRLWHVAQAGSSRYSTPSTRR